jgi:hypothetical protein
VSVLTRKQHVNDSNGLRAQAVYAARQVGPIASKSVPMAQQAAQQAAHQAVPLAKTAGTSMRHGADDAVAWATPRVDAARAWAAPQLEQSARAISESLAPTISAALMNAARKIDAPVRKKPRRRGLIVGIVLLVAACGAAAASMLLRQQPVEVTSVTIAEEDGPPDPDMNGHSQIV